MNSYTPQALQYQLELTDARHELEAAQKQLEKVRSRLEEDIDDEYIDKRKKKRSRLYREITELSKRIEELEYAIDHCSIEEKFQDLEARLKNEEAWLPDIQRAYQQTVNAWPDEAPSAATLDTKILVAQIITELTRMGDVPDQYDAFESFLAYLIELATSPTLIESLREWGAKYYKNRNWKQLYEDHQQALLDQQKNYHPAILIVLELDEDATTQKNNQPHYRLLAWLVNDIETYQNKPTGYVPLLKTDDLLPFALEQPDHVKQLEQIVQPLLQQWIKEVKQLLSTNDPEFYFFMPKTLLNLGVDNWPIDQAATSKLGQLYAVIISCTDRLLYGKDRWETFWNHRQWAIAQKLAAAQVFIPIDFQNWKSFYDALDAAETALQKSEAEEVMMGVKFQKAPCPQSAFCSEMMQEVIQELLKVGVPMAIWGRCTEKEIDNAKELEGILAAPIEALSATVRNKRSKSERRGNTPTLYIGHHLSLLQDNPRLPLPIWLRAV